MTKILAFRNLIHGEPTDSHVPSPEAEAKGGQSAVQPRTGLPPQTLDGVAAKSGASVLEAGATSASIRYMDQCLDPTVNSVGWSILMPQRDDTRTPPAEMQAPSYPSQFDHFCLGCKRLLLPGELYADGFRDGQVYCHSCLRDAFLCGYYTAEETIEGRESTEGRYGQ